MTDINQPTTPPDPPRKPKKPKPKSRADRWADAVGRAKDAINAMMSAQGDLDDALSDLTGVQQEYEEWKDNLPENLANSPVGEKLQTICDLSLDDVASEVQSALETAEGVLDEAENAELPLGFGRD